MNDEREQPLRLKVVEGPDAGREFGLDRSAVIGRSARSADLVLHDPEVSRRHASLHLGEQGLRIEDLQSTNGTFVNDEGVTGHRQVHPGDRLKIGTTVLEVEVAAGLEPEQVTPVEGAAEEEPTAVDVEADEAAAEPTAEEEPTAVEVTEEPEEAEPEEPEPEPEEPEPEVEPEVAEAEPEEPEPEPEEAEVEPEPEEAEPAAEEAVEAESGETAEPEEAPEPEEEPAAEEPEPARESEAPPAGVMEAISAAEIAKDLHARVVESFEPVLHAWSNRDSDEMRPYVSDAYLDRTIDSLEELENDFQFNSIEELDLKDVAVRRPSGDEGEAVEAYLAFLARDWIEDLRTGEVIDGDSSEVRAFLERWTFVREGRRGWVIDRVESVWTGSLDEAASQAWPGLPPATTANRCRCRSACRSLIPAVRTCPPRGICSRRLRQCAAFLPARGHCQCRCLCRGRH